MILDKRPRALIFAFFCLAATLGGGARAAQVYPGCAVPPTTFNHIWYIDPINGKTPAAGGNGSQTAPWNSLQGVVSSTKQAGYSYPMLSTVPYDHYPQKNAQGARFGADGPSSDPTRVQPGDEILLMGGQYGDISIGAYGFRTTNSAFVTIAAVPGQTPVFSSLAASASSYFMFSGIKVQSLASKGRALINIGDGGATAPCEYANHNIVERNGAAGMFVGFDPAKFVYDLRLRPGALAIGAKGNSADAPPLDITGAPRGSPVDIGAYQHSPGK